MRSFSSPGLCCGLLFALSVVLPSDRATAAADVSFYAIQKSQKFNQGSSGAPTLGGGNPYRFGGVVAPTSPGSVVSASVSAPGGAPQDLSLDPTYGFLDSNAKFGSEAALDLAAPSGSYTLLLNTLHDGQRTLKLNMPAETFPNAPHISNWSDAQIITPGAEFTLRWDPFTGGTTNDFILVVMGDQNTGVVNFRTPAPLQAGALDGTAASVLIPAQALQANTAYLVEITFLKVQSIDLTSYAGVSGVVVFDSFTDATLLTTVPIQMSVVSYSKAAGLRLQLTGEPGRNYLVQFSTNLTHWSELTTTNLPAAAAQIVDPQAAQAPARFYRTLLAN
jgi:hypothetical protein